MSSKKKKGPAKVGKAKKAATPKGVKIEREIEMALTDKAKVERGERAYKLLEEAVQLEAEFTKEKKAWKERIATKHVEARKLLEQFGTGREKQKLTVTEVVDFEKKSVEYWYGGKVVDRARMDDIIRSRHTKSPINSAGDVKEDLKQQKLELKTPEEKKAADFAKNQGGGNVVPMKPSDDKACVAVPGKAPPRGEKQTLTPAGQAINDRIEREAKNDIASTIREETSRNGKSSAVDGPRA